MIPQQFLLFVPTALLLALAPGPDNLGVLSLGMSTGRRAAVGFAAGCAVGCLNHTLLAAAGVSTLITASPAALRLTQYCGAAYLCWMAYQTLRSMLDPQRVASAHGVLSASNLARTHFKRGLISNAINPKVAIFFLAFLPQFVVPDTWPVWLQLAMLGTLFAACTGVVFVVIALGADWIGAKLRDNQSARKLLEAATATLFLGLAVRLAITDLHGALRNT
ncbi:MAG: LysE family translocator [Uliginosibacterium sp.]|nr:LysE family translocator [Uliginosibacterium sp.]MBK9392633.1 LysE family translocator [Uliginosibacterium sp.]MBK9616740.1 LysE family translocator [Uliginosibacterium sp.]